jgi:hypothetical protein
MKELAASKPEFRFKLGRKSFDYSAGPEYSGTNRPGKEFFYDEVLYWRLQLWRGSLRM